MFDPRYGPQLPPRELRFGSRSEASLAQLFERYIPDWKAEMGKTCQIPIGPYTIDFLVDGALVEYHPILLSREMRSAWAKRELRSVLNSSPKWARDAIISCVAEELGEQYAYRRWQLVRQSEWAGTPLFVCHDPRQVWEQLIGPARCTLKDFCDDFYRGLNGKDAAR